ncbi:MAG: hypothetical protein JNL03_08070 [Prolixibacteraceae bacterium]|nr:hypothetical protein [Prolixibacteraceae bacterium]
MYEEKNTEPDFLKRTEKNPFRTPDHYFESLEDRVMANIEYQTQKKSSPTKLFQLLKPALGLVASFALVYLLVYYPINTFLLKDTALTSTDESTTSSQIDAYTLNFSLVDESTFISTLFSDDTDQTANINPDEFLAYLSTGMSDVEIYSEIQN